MRRVVVTGLGIVCPAGIGRREVWRRSLEGRCLIRALRRFDASDFPCRTAGEIDGFDASEHLPRKVVKQTDRSTWIGFACCRLAAEDAALDLAAEPPDEIGMCFASVFGGMEFAEPELYAQRFLGPRRVSAYQAIAWFYAATQGQWSIASGIRGWGKSVVGDRVGGHQAIGLAAEAIRTGHCRLAFAGGFEAPLAPFSLAIHRTSGLMADDSGPGGGCAYRPFDRTSRGLVLAEGGSVLLLEELEHARRRDAHVWAEVLGFDTASDDPRGGDAGEGLARCLCGAVSDAGLTPDAISHVVAEGLATKDGDRAEAAALAAVFGSDGGPTVSAPKSMTGHTLSGAGALDAAWASLMLHEGVLLPTVHLGETDPFPPLRHVREVTPAEDLRALAVVGRGAGGTNAALVLGRWAEA